MKSFLLALQFLTVATVNSGLRAGSLDLARSRAWYSVVGGLVGLVLAGGGLAVGLQAAAAGPGRVAGGAVGRAHAFFAL